MNMIRFQRSISSHHRCAPAGKGMKHHGFTVENRFRMTHFGVPRPIQSCRIRFTASTTRLRRIVSLLTWPWWTVTSAKGRSTLWRHTVDWPKSHYAGIGKRRQGYCVYGLRSVFKIWYMMGAEWVMLIWCCASVYQHSVCVFFFIISSSWPSCGMFACLFLVIYARYWWM